MLSMLSVPKLLTVTGLRLHSSATSTMSPIWGQTVATFSNWLSSLSSEEVWLCLLFVHLKM